MLSRLSLTPDLDVDPAALDRDEAEFSAALPVLYPTDEEIDRAYAAMTATAERVPDAGEIADAVARVLVRHGLTREAA